MSLRLRQVFFDDLLAHKTTPMINRPFLAALAVLCLTTVSGFTQAPSADLVIMHARIWTVDSGGKVGHPGTADKMVVHGW